MLCLPASPFVRRAALLGFMALCVALPAQAQWKWKDAAGKIQYSDLPPPAGTPEKDVLQRPPGQRLQVLPVPIGGAVNTAASAPATAAAASAPSKADLEQQAKLKQQEREQQAKLKEEERRFTEQRRENCARARENLQLLQDKVRITRQNEKGEFAVLDENQRADEMRRTRSVIDSDCK